ncbi:MAG: hypothetical protein RL307_465 [Pseudomonadota bacterium]
MLNPSLLQSLKRHHWRPTALVQILHDVQDDQGWLSPEALQTVAGALHLPLARVQATASFYSFFYTRPVGRYRILFSDNITDRMLGAPALMDRLCKALWLERGHVSEDGLVSVDTTSCTGLCDQGPALLVNGRPMGRLSHERIDAMVELIRQQIPLDQWPSEWFEVSNPVHRRDWLLQDPMPAGNAVKAALERGAKAMLDELKASGLRGRGGAGFSTGAKWQACQEAPGSVRHVVCNADEGEPGTFKDRVLLSEHFDALIDGMQIAAIVIGARHGLIYLRAEYRHLLPRLEQCLAERRAHGLLGAKAFDGQLDFDVQIHLGAGAYICGEESALIESLEGKPGKPRIRPPFPVTQGYLGEPTLVNNVETFVAVARMALTSAAAMRERGTAQSSGTKLLSISGDVQRPGVYEVPFGISLNEVLALCGGESAQAVTTAGAAGNCLPRDQFHRRLGFEDVATGGSIMVFGPERDLFDLALNVTQFFAHESCGFCTPCRVGTAVNLRLMNKLAKDHGSPHDLHELDRMHALMHGASHCGLGNTASMVLNDLRHHFPHVFERRLHSNQYEPAFDLDAALSQARQMTHRDDAGAHLGDNRSEHLGEAFVTTDSTRKDLSS